MRIDVRSDFKGIDTALRVSERQVPYALAVALTRTAMDVSAAQRNEMSNVFDRPTTYTLNALFVRRATKASLQAEVGLKDGAGHRHFLPVQIEGGNRPQKGLERMLTRAGLMRADERAVPGLGATLDGYGNMSRGQVQKIISQLRLSSAVGFDVNATDSKRSKAKRAREAYFVSLGPRSVIRETRTTVMRQHLPRGVWVRLAFGARETAVQPVLLFVNRAAYAKRLPFYEVAERTIKSVFSSHFDRAFADAMRTARP